MSQLVPCPGCERHVRLSDPNCPFCGRELDGNALGAVYAARRGAVPRGLKRAALVALGASVAAACGGRTDGTGQDTQPVASTGLTSEESSGSSSAFLSPPSSGTDTRPDDGSLVAIYGAPVPPPAIDTQVPGTTAPEVSTSDDDDDDNGVAVPPYGFPVITQPDLDTTSAPEASSSTSAPDLDTGSDTGPELDAGASDAGLSDATESDAGLPTESPIMQPAYGAPILD